ncbi:MAG: hypothetical protein HYX73_03885 [Acidobacteria bacterium]|nr:hypothetical protein [Acidobacteriota bacterium]
MGKLVSFEAARGNFGELQEHLTLLPRARRFIFGPLRCDNPDAMTATHSPQPAPTGPPAARFAELRRRHPRFVYERFTLGRAGPGFHAQFRFHLEPDIEFTPEIIIKTVDWARVEEMPRAALENLFFPLGLVEMLSYWKAACSPEIVIRAGSLPPEQIAWWMDLLRRGMGEYFYVNQIDFRAPDLVRILSAPRTIASSAVIPSESRAGRGTTRDLHLNSSPQNEEKQIARSTRNDTAKNLVLTSGGKDSVVTLETLCAAGQPFDCLLINPAQSALDIAREAGCAKPIIIRRTIDNRLLALNAAGYLNGHTPFSALLAFLGVTVAALFGHRRVIVSNERSAEEASVEYLGAQINHQYSKTFEFETAFREYSRKYLSPEIEYFSLLRPLYELQIAERFARLPQYLPLFRSCNRGMGDNTWCGRCPKCLFVWTALYPFVERDQLLQIFGKDLFTSDHAAETLRALLGLDATKPFECVGTREETLAAIHLCVEKYKLQGVALPLSLLTIEKTVLASRADLPALAQHILASGTEKHHIPADLVPLLRRQN